MEVDGYMLHISGAWRKRYPTSPKALIGVC